MSSRTKFRPLTGVLLLVVVVLVIVAFMYFTKTADALPSFFPGHTAGSTHKHVKHGIAAIGLACLAAIGAWFSSAPGAGAKR
ncbi:MAG: hypothetical protein QOE15_228 [Acidimicrobiaceae bacterium]|nr:hypothetical protein [Acidimicrobiaceae bacterium]